MRPDLTDVFLEDARSAFVTEWPRALFDDSRGDQRVLLQPFGDVAFEESSICSVSSVALFPDAAGSAVTASGFVCRMKAGQSAGRKCLDPRLAPEASCCLQDRPRRHTSRYSGSGNFGAVIIGEARRRQSSPPQTAWRGWNSKGGRPAGGRGGTVHTVEWRFLIPANPLPPGTEFGNYRRVATASPPMASLADYITAENALVLNRDDSRLPSRPQSFADRMVPLSGTRVGGRGREARPADRLRARTSR